MSSAPESLPPANGSPAPGSVFGRYAIEAELGRGGQGTVFLARDTQLGRAVALKVLHPRGGLSEPQRQRLLREGMLAARIDHPSACEVYDCGIIDGHPFLAMRHVDGERVTDVIARGTGGRTSLVGGEVERRLLWCEQCAEALHCAHQLGILHRDVKPGNLIVTPQGRAVLLDFGLAKQMEDGSMSLTADGMLCGTPAYMSPEQLMVDAPPLDGRTDVYSLGVTLYELVTGRSAFGNTGEWFPTLASRQVLPDMRPVERTWNRDLRAVLERALAPDRAQRYDSARSFADDLRCCRQRLPVAARPAGVALRLRRWAARNRALAAVLSLLILSLLAGTAFSIGYAIDAARARDQSEWRRYTGGVQLGAQLIAAGERAGAVEVLDDSPADLRGFEWRLLRARADASLAAIAPGAGAIVGIGGDENGAPIVLAADGSRHAVDASHATSRPIASPAPSPGGADVLVDARGGTDATVWTEGDDARLRIERPGGTFVVSCPVQRPTIVRVRDDGAFVVVASDRGFFRVAAADGAVSGVARGLVRAVAFARSPDAEGADGAAVVAVSDVESEERCVARLHRLADLGVVREFPIHGGYLDAAAVSRDGRRLVVATRRRGADRLTGAVTVFDLGSGLELARHDGPFPGIRSILVAPDDDWVAFGDHSGVIRVLDGALAAESCRLLGCRGEVTALYALGAGLLLAGDATGECRVFSASPARREALQRWPVIGITGLGFDRGDDSLVVGSSLAVRRYDLAGGGPVQQWRGWSLHAAVGQGSEVWTVFGGDVHARDLRTGVSRQVVAGTVALAMAKPAAAPTRGRIHFAVERVGTIEILVAELAAEGSPVVPRTFATVPDSGRPRLVASRDGRRLALGCGRNLSVWDADTAALLATREVPAEIAALSVGDDGALAVAIEGLQILCGSVAESAWRSIALPAPATCIALHPTEPRFAVGSAQGYVSVCDTVHGSRVVTFEQMSAAVMRLAFSASGERLAVALANGDVELLGRAVRPEPTAPPVTGECSSPIEAFADRFAARRRMFGYEGATTSVPYLAEIAGLPELCYRTIRRCDEVNVYAMMPGELAYATAFADLRLGDAAAALRSLGSGTYVQMRRLRALALASSGRREERDEAIRLLDGVDGAAGVPTGAVPIEIDVVVRDERGLDAAAWLRRRDGASLSQLRAEVAALSDRALAATVAKLLDLRTEPVEVLRMFAWLVVSTPGLDAGTYRQALGWAGRIAAAGPLDRRPELEAFAHVRLGDPAAALAALAGEHIVDPARAVVADAVLALAHAAAGDRAEAWRAASRFIVRSAATDLRQHERRRELRAEIQRALDR